MSQTLLLIDGNSIINRAYYGMAGRSRMTAPDSTPTGAVFGFLNIYFKHFQDYHPDRVCVCFDLKGPTFRHKEYPEYKATRKEMPEDLAVQMPVLKEVLDAMGITRIEIAGFEADDLIGSVSAEAERKGWMTYILSGDKDDLQLVSNRTILLMPFSKEGKTITEIYDPAAVEKRYSVLPEHFVDLKAIMGDPSDNIPGVRGIGEKGATELISKYKTLDGVYGAISEIKTGVADKLRDSREMAYLSRKLSDIKRDIDVTDVFDLMDSAEQNQAEMLKIFRRLGFRSFISKLELKENEIESNIKHYVNHSVTDKPVETIERNRIREIINEKDAYVFPDLPDPGMIFREICTDDSCLKEEFAGVIHSGYRRFICINYIEGCGILIDAGQERHFLIRAEDLSELLIAAKQKAIFIAGYELKSIFRNLETDPDDVCLYDIAVSGYLLNISESGMSFELVAERTLDPGGYVPPADEKRDEIIQQSFFDDIRLKKAAEPSIKDRYDLSILSIIVLKQTEMLKERKLLYLALYVEMPLIRILSGMERTGFLIDTNVLDELNNDFSAMIGETEERIYSSAGSKFNINSPKQLGEVLFDKLGLPSGKKSKTGYSTNMEVLDSLYNKHPVIADIMRYRELTKLRSTFLEGLSKSIDPSDGRIHTTFHQTLTSTGRLSSSNPNVQNIPVKTETGREIRRAFIAGEGMLLVDADYSQIELRLLADFSGDEQMLSAFRDNDDIHMRTAEELFDLPREMITPAMRSAAKTINFSIVYGIGDFSLAKDLGITMAQAHQYIEEYHKKYPKVRPYLGSLLKKAYETGFVETMFRRRRYIEELKSANRNIRLFGERAAMNAPVQGSAADIIKVAMVILDNRLRKESIGARLVLQVHDELILEVPEDGAVKAAEILKECMENAVKLSVPLIAEVEMKKDWF